MLTYNSLEQNRYKFACGLERNSLKKNKCSTDFSYMLQKNLLQLSDYVIIDKNLLMISNLKCT